MSSTFAFTFKKLALIASLAACASSASAEAVFNPDLYGQPGVSGGSLTFFDATNGTGSLTFSSELINALTIGSGNLVFSPYQPGIDTPVVISPQTPLVIDALRIDLSNNTLYGITNLGLTTGATPLWSFAFPGSSAGTISVTPGFSILPTLPGLSLTTESLTLLTSTLTFNVSSAVPEPSGMMLLGAGLACAGLALRRRAR